MRLVHLDVCLPDYFRGYHRPILGISVHKGMTPQEFADAVTDEYNAIWDYLVSAPQPWPDLKSEEIRELALNTIPEGVTDVFPDLDPITGDDGDPVCCYFIIEEEPKMKTETKTKTKTKTKPATEYYTNCHPAIKEELMKGNAILCEVWDGNPEYKRKGWVYVYDCKSVYSYRVELVDQDPDEGGRFVPFRFASPAAVKPKVKSAPDIMQVLVARGYEPDAFGDWDKADAEFKFDGRMWQYCGKEPPTGYSWEPEWLEEI